MRWMIVCVSCGAKMQVGDVQIGRQLQCPGCQRRVTAAAPAPVAPPASIQRIAPKPLRRWIVGALASPVLLASVAGVAWMNWSEEDTGPRGAISQAYLPPRGGKAGPVTVDSPVPPVLERGIEAMVNVSSAPEGRLTGRETGRSLDLVGKVPANLAAVVDPNTGTLLAATHDGRLAWFDTKECRPVGACRLERPAYQMLIDGPRRRLYVAASSGQLEVGQLGDRDRGPGDIYIYDLELILNGKDTLAKPTRRLNLDAHVTGMILSKSGDELYFSAETTHDVHISRVNTRTWTRDRNRWMRVSPPTALAMAPDGPLLHALAGGRLLLLNPTTWKVLDSVAVGGSVTSLQVGKAGRVYLLERRHSSQIQVVDLPRRKMLVRWTLDTDGRPYIHLSPDANQLYLGTSAVATGRIWSIDVTGEPGAEPRFTGHAMSDKTRLLRGGLHVLGPEPLLVTGSGFVFRGRNEPLTK